MVRVVLDEFLRQVAHEVDEILFAQLCIQAYFHRAWVQRVGDIEIRPRIVADHHENPVSHGVDRLSDGFFRAAPDVGVELRPRHVMQADSIPEVPENSRDDQAQRRRKIDAARNVGPDPPRDSRERYERERDEERNLTLPDPEERALIQRRLKAEDAVDYPAGRLHARPAELFED